MKKINYLNNRDILKEIHKSKGAYCSFTQPEYADYDIILMSVADIPAKLEEGKEARADRLTRKAQDLAIELEGKKSATAVPVDPASILDTDVIFRVMTWDHIPESTALPKVVKGKKGKSILDEEAESLLTEYDDELPEVIAPSPKFVKVNFPPFMHYKLNSVEEPVIVGKSHWTGDVETGEFSKDHGQVTKKLALMYMKLCERYATRSNWRGYTYNDEMRSQALLQLSQVGLQFDESKSQNPFAYYTTAITNSFTRVLNIEKRNQNIRDDILEMHNLNPSYTRQGMGSGGYHGADSGSDD